MKLPGSFSLISIFFALTLQAQSYTYHYSYDDSGNRTLRSLELPGAGALQEEEMEDGTYENKHTLSDVIGPYSLQLFPNPTQGELKVQVNTEEEKLDAKLQVRSLNGNLIYDFPVHPGNNAFNLDELKASTYIILIRINGHTKEFKLIKL